MISDYDFLKSEQNFKSLITKRGTTMIWDKKILLVDDDPAIIYSIQYGTKLVHQPIFVVEKRNAN